MASTVTVENERGCLYGVCDETVSYVPLVTVSSRTSRTPFKGKNPPLGGDLICS